MKFAEIYDMSLDRLSEGLEFTSGKEVVDRFLSGNLDKALRMESLPGFYKETDESLLEQIFDRVISSVRQASTPENRLSPVQPVLLMLRKAKSFEDLKRMSSMQDTLIELARTSNTGFRKSEMYKAITIEPFSPGLWHDFEKAAQEYHDTSTHQATASSHTYETLYDDGEWKLFVPRSFEDDSHLAGGMEEFKCRGRGTATTKAQWCTAADKGYFDRYTRAGNCLYVIKHYKKDGNCDRVWQVAFCEEGHVEIKDKRDEETGLKFLYGKAPEKLLAFVKNDNPKCTVRNSLLDYVEMSRMMGEYKNIDSLIFCDREALEGYIKNGVYLYESGKIPDFVENIMISDSVTSIGNSAFSYCKSLESVTIPDSVTSIGDCAFE